MFSLISTLNAVFVSAHVPPAILLETALLVCLPSAPIPTPTVNAIFARTFSVLPVDSLRLTSVLLVCLATLLSTETALLHVLPTVWSAAQLTHPYALPALLVSTAIKTQPASSVLATLPVCRAEPVFLRCALVATWATTCQITTPACHAQAGAPHAAMLQYVSLY